jgi:plasmid segregation protein ParM
MDVSFDSALIKDTTRRIFGRRGLQSGMSIEEFDVYSHISKAKQALSFILTLGCIAGKAIYDYWQSNKTLPDDVIQVTVNEVALALPIGEYKKYRKDYAESYKATDHVVTMYNFEKEVKVKIHFEDVQIIAEGASAQYAIVAKGEQLMNAMLADVRKMGLDLEGITAKDILEAKNTVGIDIGEGTVNFPVFQNGKFNPDASATFDKGYGAVLNAALERLQDQGHPFSSRKALQEFLNTTPNKLAMRRYEIVRNVVDEEITAFVNEVGMQFSRIMTRIGSFLEVIYVYGGGAGPIQNELYPLLMDKTRAYGNGEAFYPVLYLDSRYSRFLNRDGLMTMALQVEKARTQQKK